MNLQIIIPKQWNPEKPNAFNAWINKINNKVKKQKL